MRRVPKPETEGKYISALSARGKRLHKDTIALSYKSAARLLASITIRVIT